MNRDNPADDFKPNDPLQSLANSQDNQGTDAQKLQPPPKPKISVSPGMAKEKEVGGAFFKEQAPTIIEKKEFEPPPEVEGWMEKLEKGEEITLPGPVKDEYGQILMEAARDTKPKIVLPLQKQKIEEGLKEKVTNSFRWLSEWCLRVIKMFPNRITFKTN